MNEQFGFRIVSSTVKANHKLLKAIINALHNKKKWYVVYSVIYKKTLDCVNHKILLRKLEFYVIRSRFHNLIKSYLKDRYQKVQIISNIYNNRTSSDWHKISHGVPQ